MSNSLLNNKSTIAKFKRINNKNVSQVTTPQTTTKLLLIIY